MSADRFLLVLLVAAGFAGGVQVTPDESSRTKPFSVRGRVPHVTAAVYVTQPLPCLSPASWSWGSDASCPQLAVAAVTLGWRDRDVHTPLSAFAGLGNPTSMVISGRDAGFELRITGGDAATSYVCVLEYGYHKGADDMRIVRRLVRHREFPEDVWEETRYSFHDGSDPPIP